MEVSPHKWSGRDAVRHRHVMGIGMIDDLQLTVLAHPDEARIDEARSLQAADGATLVGRDPICGIHLEHVSISRRHAVFDHDGEHWTVMDLGSRHGTFLNGERIDAEEPRQLTGPCRLQFGPFVLRASVAGLADGSMITFDNVQTGETSVSVITPSQRRGLAQQRLDVLIRAAASLTAASDVDQLAREVLLAACLGSGAARALLLQPTDNELNFGVLASHGIDVAAGGAATRSISRSLVRLALQGRPAQLTPGSGDLSGVASIMELGIGSAIGVPVRVGETVQAVLYLDTRGQEEAFRSDAAAFCEALAGFCGLAMADLQRRQIEREQAALKRDLDTARRVQEQIMPPPSGVVGPIRYASLSIPGRLVAGDLLDIVPLDEHRTMLMLGRRRGQGHRRRDADGHRAVVPSRPLDAPA